MSLSVKGFMNSGQGFRFGTLGSSMLSLSGGFPVHSTRIGVPSTSLDVSRVSFYRGCIDK